MALALKQRTESLWPWAWSTIALNALWRASAMLWFQLRALVIHVYRRSFWCEKQPVF